MAVAKSQLPIEGLKTQAEAAAEANAAETQRERRAELRLRLLNAIKRHARLIEYTRCAEAIDADAAVFRGDKEGGDSTGNKGVSASLFRSCLESSERNYFRLDWLFWFIDESEDVRSVLIEAIGLPEKDPKEELQDLRDLVRSEMPKQADRIIRKAAEPRRR